MNVFFDLDGTLYHGAARVPGADRLVAALRERGVPHWFLTNNSSRTPEEVAAHLCGMEIAAEPEQVITSAQAAADYAASRHPGGTAYVIGEAGLRRALAASGLRLLAEDEGGQADLVVVGIDRAFTYGKLAAAVRQILGGAAYVLTNPDRQLPTDGGLQPGAGSLGAAVTEASGVQPVVAGKPSAVMMDYALRRAGARAADAWVVGDNPHTDLAGAKTAGCRAVLTLTGLCSAGDWEARCRAAEVEPDAVCADLGELRDLLLHRAQG